MLKFFNITLNHWLKSIHILFVCFWLGAVFSVIVVFLSTFSESDKNTIISNSLLMEKIDYYIIIPFSTLSYLSGLLISWKTNWGFFKYKWIVFKIITGTLLILFGVFFLAPWIYQSQIEINQDFSKYTHIQNKLGISMMVQFVVIIFLVFVSALKPWKKFKSIH